MTLGDTSDAVHTPFLSTPRLSPEEWTETRFYCNFPNWLSSCAHFPNHINDLHWVTYFTLGNTTKLCTRLSLSIGTLGGTTWWQVANGLLIASPYWMFDLNQAEMWHFLSRFGSPLSDHLFLFMLGSNRIAYNLVPDLNTLFRSSCSYFVRQLLTARTKRSLLKGHLCLTECVTWKVD